MSSDGQRILKSLARHRTFLDFTDENSGRDLCKIATDGVQETIASQTTPDGAAWPKLSDSYEAWKSRHFPGQPMAVLHGIMADPVQVAGYVETTADRATTQYGVSQEARDEASWFQEGDPAQNRPPRRFWGFTPNSIDGTRSYLSDRFKRKIR